MSLRRFEKIFLKATETKEVSLILTQKDFATYSIKRKCFVTNPGTYELYLGTSALDILYHTSIEITQEYAL